MIHQALYCLGKCHNAEWIEYVYGLNRDTDNAVWWQQSKRWWDHFVEEWACFIERRIAEEVTTRIQQQQETP
jgi:hypothetical protein